MGRWQTLAPPASQTDLAEASTSSLPRTGVPPGSSGIGGNGTRMLHVIGVYRMSQVCGLRLPKDPDALCPLCARQKGKSLLNHSETQKSRENVLERFPATEIGGYCDECGAPYPAGRRGKPRRFCSPRCRKQSWLKGRAAVSIRSSPG
jgi:endogenous inhibitor of DNA gyrase (YacG/DUF329 family)